MSNTEKHSDHNQDFEKLTNNFFGKAEIPFEKSKEDIWNKLESKLDLEYVPETKRVISYRMTFAIAATVLLLVAVFSVFRFYTTTIESPAGLHLTAMLPDGSSVEMNAESTISYKPLWWRFSRTVKFEGEGFFEVEKGEKFTVTSNLAKTVVLGTSFNINTRNDQYAVICYTGKVKISIKKIMTSNQTH